MALNEVDSLMENDVVRIYTASNPDDPYLIPVTLLEDQSELFSKSILGNQDAFYFQDDDPEVWQTYLHWLVKHELRKDLFRKVAYDQDFEYIVDCYVLAEKYGLKAFQDEVMLFLLEALEECSDNHPRTERLKRAILVAFQKASKGSKLLTVLVEYAAREGLESWGEFPLGMEMTASDFVDFEGLGFYQFFSEKTENGTFPEASRFSAKGCEPEYFWKTYMVGPAEKYETARYQKLDEPPRL